MHGALKYAISTSSRGPRMEADDDASNKISTMESELPLTLLEWKQHTASKKQRFIQPGTYDSRDETNVNNSSCSSSSS